MRNLSGCLAAVLVIAMGAIGPVGMAEDAGDAGIPRTASGHPDFNGVWTNSSITTLERSNPSLPLVPSADQVAGIEKARTAYIAEDDAPIDPEQGAPAAGGGVGGYNAFWIGFAEKIGRVNGEPRTSWIVSPDSGKMPVSDAGKERIRQVLARRGDDGPEGLNPADRCLVGSRGSGGPPMLNNIYNNTYQFLQTDAHVVINVEMMHDARIIRMEGAHKPEPVEQWLGDSIGRWDGDTLVVETRNWQDAHGAYEPVFLSEQAVVTERFTLTAPDAIFYEFTIDDPGYYSQTWKGEMTFYPSNGPVFEYACHEGNYAMTNILNGARLADGR